MTQLAMGTFVAQGATFDPARVYRYRLWRQWDATKPSVGFIMLNPSTADESVLDPTLLKCMKFARRWGHGGMEIANLFALRSTDPSALETHPSPVGPDNDAAIHEVCERVSLVVYAWGVHGTLLGRDREVVRLVHKIRHLPGMAVLEASPPCCLKRTKGGHPQHPLYLPDETDPILYEARP